MDYTFYLNNTPSASNQFDNLNAGIYNLAVVDGNNCRYQQSIQIFEPINPDIDIDGPFSIFVGNSGILSISTNVPASLINNIIWEENDLIICEGCTQVEVSPEISSVYCVTIEFNDQCSVNTCVDLRVEIEKNIYTPNVFSPNDDGINDFFTIYTNNVALQINFLKIFDRWGEMVFEIEDIATDREELGWDGKFNGVFLNPGVYVFVAELKYTETNVELITGDVTIVR